MKGIRLSGVDIEARHHCNIRLESLPLQRRNIRQRRAMPVAAVSGIRGRPLMGKEQVRILVEYIDSNGQAIRVPTVPNSTTDMNDGTLFTFTMPKGATTITVT